MKYELLTLSILLFVTLNPLSTFAHPGNTASDGCHYCRTNCDKWGEAWGERHCHSGYTAPQNTNYTPTYTAPTISQPIVTSTPTINSSDFNTDSNNYQDEENYDWVWIMAIIGIIGYFKMKE